MWLNSYTRMRVNLAAQVIVKLLTVQCLASNGALYKQFIHNQQVMSESVASALVFIDNDNTQQTRLFIRMVDRFFDYMNVKSPLMAQLKRKESIAPYRSPQDPRFEVSNPMHNMHTYVTSIMHYYFTVASK